MPLLSSLTALNGSYRRTWLDYFNSPSGLTRQQLLKRLTSGMDHESKEVIRIYAEIILNFSPSQIFNYLEAPSNIKHALLPEKTKEHLLAAGFSSTRTMKRKLKDLSALLHIENGILPECLTHGGLTYIPHEAKRYISNRTVIDGGASFGDTASLFTRIYNAKKVFAFEPHPETFNSLKENVNLWGMQSRIKPQHLALSSASEKIALWGHGVGASIHRKEGLEQETPTTSNAVDIDSFVSGADITEIGMIKLDIEGCEYEAILGASETIKKFLPLLVISIYHTARDFWEIKPLLESFELGYKFKVRKATDDLIKEIILIAIPPVSHQTTVEVK